MKKILAFLVWPLITTGLALAFLAYSYLSPCDDGFLISSCNFARITIVILILSSLVFYLLISLIIKLIFRRFKKRMSLKTLIIVGIISLMIIPASFFISALTSELTFLGLYLFEKII